MSKKTCEVIKDLLPLYAEGICSEESRSIVTRHLSGCSECSEILREMGTEIRVSADRDIAVMKKIRRRIRIAKLLVGVVAGLAVLFLLWTAVFHLLNTASEMNYDRYGFADSISVELDENGGLWLIRYGLATTADGVEISADSENNLNCTLMQRAIDCFAYADLSGRIPERMLLCNIHEDPVQAVCYYEIKKDTQHILWERNGT